MENMKLQYQMSNGSWMDCQDRFEYFMEKAITENAREHEFNPDKFPLLTRAEIIAKLKAGKEVRFGTDWNQEIRSGVAYEEKIVRLLAAKKLVELVKCSCGHTVPKGSVMSASLGSSCPDCYDRMSN